METSKEWTTGFKLHKLPLTIPFFLATTRLSLNKKKAKACVGAEVMKVTQKGADSSAQLSSGTAPALVSTVKCLRYISKWAPHNQPPVQSPLISKHLPFVVVVGAAAAALAAETAGKGMAYLEHRLCNENAVVYGFQIKRERES